MISNETHTNPTLHKKNTYEHHKNTIKHLEDTQSIIVCARSQFAVPNLRPRHNSDRAAPDSQYFFSVLYLFYYLFYYEFLLESRKNTQYNTYLFKEDSLRLFRDR